MLLFSGGRRERVRTVSSLCCARGNRTERPGRVSPPRSAGKRRDYL